MTDDIIKLGNSLVQHGKHNDRAYLMKLAQTDLPNIIDRLDQLAEKRGYSKLFAKVPRNLHNHFLNAGYEVEAIAENLYHGRHDGVFLGKYLEEDRASADHPETIEGVLRLAHQQPVTPQEIDPPSDMTIRPCDPDDCPDMAELYADVFKTYPFPIHDSDYLLQTMQSHVRYYGVWRNDSLIALSSAEMDPAAAHAEMTDFATAPAARGNGLASLLLQKMEHDVLPLGIATAYTIARAVSAGMNIVFARAGYRFSGTLVNNTNISGRFESMNVWCKPIASAG